MPYRSPWMTEELDAFRDQFRRFLVKDLAPRAETWRKQRLVDRAAWRALGDMGALLPSVPESYGGLSASIAYDAAVFGDLERIVPELNNGVTVSSGIVAHYILNYGSEAQKRRWLPGMARGELIGAVAMTEPGTGSDLQSVRTTARREGDTYVINGQKTFITNGPDADVVVVYAKLDEGDGADKRDRKVLTFVLDRGMEGFVQAKPFRKMGIHSSRTGELFFNNVRLGRDRLLGETEENKSGDGRDSARSSFAAERIGVVSMALGVIEECLRLCTDYAKTRTLWGKEIGQFQLIQLKLANMEVARMNVRNMLFRVIECGQTGTQISLAEASAMKYYCSQAATDVAMEAIQLFGGNGYMTEYRVEQLARDAKSLMIYAGSNEVQITHVAKGLLGA